MYFLEIKKKLISNLEAIRHWENLKMAHHDDSVWIKDFTYEQLNSVAIKQIPFKIIYKLNDGLLFKTGSLIPAKKMPQGLLWTPILQAIKVNLPKENLNYFGIQDPIAFSLKVSDKEEKSSALMVSLEDFKEYVTTAPELRLQPLRWVIVDQMILIFGLPLLPLKGRTYWQKRNFFLPTGCDFEWGVLSDFLEEKINRTGQNVILMENDNSYIEIPKESIKPLSISSFKLTFD